MQIVISDLEKEFQGLPADVDVSAGVKVVIPCKAPKGFPPPSITWLRNGKILSLIEGKRYDSYDKCFLVCFGICQ